jgi:hypothetical protein
MRGQSLEDTVMKEGKANNREERKEIEREQKRSRDFQEQEGNRNQQVGRQAREQQGWDEPGAEGQREQARQRHEGQKEQSPEDQ